MLQSERSAFQRAESEWERWCKSKGMSPGEFSDEDREKFIGRIS